VIDDRINVKLISQTPAICHCNGECVLVVIVVIIIIIVVIVVVIIIVVVGVD